MQGYFIKAETEPDKKMVVIKCFILYPSFQVLTVRIDSECKIRTGPYILEGFIDRIATESRTGCSLLVETSLRMSSRGTV